MELGRLINHDIIIRPSDNKGFIINVGCGKFTANNESMLLNCLGAYLSDPEKKEKEYNEKICSEPAVTRSTPSDIPGPTPRTPQPTQGGESSEEKR